MSFQIIYEHKDLLVLWSEWKYSWMLIRVCSGFVWSHLGLFLWERSYVPIPVASEGLSCRHYHQ